MTKEKLIKRFEDLEPDHFEVDDQVKIDDLLDRDLFFDDYIVLEGKHGDYFEVKVSDPKTKKTVSFTTGGQVIMKKLLKAKDGNHLPLIGKIIKDKDYYDLV